MNPSVSNSITRNIPIEDMEDGSPVLFANTDTFF